MNPSTAPVTQPRRVERLITGQLTRDGAGVKLTRVLTHDLQQRLDPFLMLDHFGSDDPKDYGAGFPDHPHRGFETVTYMIAGRMRHKDSAGHEGLLQNGGVQWMTAGRGVIHSEMPGKDKLCAPWYRDIQSADIPEFQTAEGVTVRVIAGESVGPQGPVAGSMRRAASAWPTDPLYLDLHFHAGTASFSQHLAADHNAFIYVYRGTVEVGDAQGRGTQVPLHRMAILANEGDGVTLRASAAARALLIAGRPLREPIAQYGPFVMNTRHELMQAVEDFQAGRFV